MKRHFYAIRRPYGLDVINNGGNRANQVHRFSTLAAALAWVNEEPETREIIKASDYAARKARRYAKLGLSWPQSVMD